MGLEVARTSLALELSWWQGAVVVAGCLLAAWLCCYSASCCYLTLDCCSDPYWGCCAWCRPCVRPSNPPPPRARAPAGQEPRPGGEREHQRQQVQPQRELHGAAHPRQHTRQREGGHGSCVWMNITP